MGRVWRATDVVLHRDVAIKELVPPAGLTAEERQEMRERLLREARAIARLHNMNVVRVFDVLRTDGDPWIVMEYVASRSMQDTLAADGPFSPLRAAEIGLGVLGALRAAHRAGVVHRDVKPGNVLMGDDGRVVLTDFGLATVPGDPNVTRTGLVLGSPAYIAPERARDGTAGPAADLWSLGATLFAAVEGASPFARATAIATLTALATENPPPARNAGPLKPVLNGLLRKDPAHRINAEEAERLLLRAIGRKSRLSLPLSPTMRRPGISRERSSAPSGAPSAGPNVPGAKPSVPSPRPPTAQASTAPPTASDRPRNDDARPPVYVPGKATVGRPAAASPTQSASARPPAARPKLDSTKLDSTKVDGPKVDGPKVDGPKVDGPKVDGPKLDSTKVDGPKLDSTKVDGPKLDHTKIESQRQNPITPDGTQQPAAKAATPTPRAAEKLSTGLTRTNRGEPGALTAADVAAYRGEQAASESAKAQTEVAAADAETDPSKAAADSAAAEKAAIPEPATALVLTASSAAANAAARETADAASAPATVTEAQVGANDVTAAQAEAGASDVTAQADTTDAQAEADVSATEVKAAAAEATDGTASEAESAGTASRAPEKSEPQVPDPKAADAESAPTATAKAAPTATAKATPTALTGNKAAGGSAIAPVPPQSAGTSSTRKSSSPEFSRSTRPAWTPMPARPTPTRPRGITVLGVRATYRQLSIVGVLLLVAVLVIVLILNFGGGRDRSAKQVSKPVLTSTAATPAASTAPSVAESAAPSSAASAAAVVPLANSAPANSAPAKPSPEPSTTPPTTENGTLPAGFVLYHDKTGFSVPIWAGASLTQSGSELYIRKNNRLLIVDQTNQPKSDPLQDWKDQEAARVGQLQNYHKIKIVSVPYFQSSADWEYTYTTSNGNPQHAVKRNVLVNSHQAYALSWFVSPDDWDASLPELQAIYQGFQPKK